MAHIFEITASPEKAVPLTTNGTGEVAFTVTNVTAAAVKGRAVLGPERSPVLQWMKLIGEAERVIQAKMSDTFVVNVNVPPGTKPGDYSFRLDAISVSRPDEDSTQGPAIGIPVTLTPLPPKPFPWWILVAAAVIMGAVSYAALKLIPGGVEVPDLSQKSLAEGKAMLTARHLNLGAVDKLQVENSKVDLILKQSPAPLAKVAPGSSINVQIGMAMAAPLPTAQPEVVAAPVAPIVQPEVVAAPETDPRVIRGEALANQDPLAAAFRDAQPEGPGRRGFHIGMAAAEGQTAPGPGKDRMHDSLPVSEQEGFARAVQFSLERNKNIPLPARGAAIALGDAPLAEKRNAGALGFYTLGFDIATGIFGNATKGGAGNTIQGPGSKAIHDALERDGQRGFESSYLQNTGKHWQ